MCGERGRLSRLRAVVACTPTRAPSSRALNSLSPSSGATVRHGALVGVIRALVLASLSRDTRPRPVGLIDSLNGLDGVPVGRARACEYAVAATVFFLLLRPCPAPLTGPSSKDGGGTRGLLGDSLRRVSLALRRPGDALETGKKQRDKDGRPPVGAARSPPPPPVLWALLSEHVFARSLVRWR